MESTNTSTVNKFFQQYSLLLIALTIALVLRLAVVIECGNTIYWEDEHDYLHLSQQIVSGNGYVNQTSQPTAFRPVGYPLLLAGLRILGVRSIMAIRLFQIALSLLSIVLIYAMTRRFFSHKSAIITAFIASVYPYFVFVPSTLLATTWFSTLLIAATFLVLCGLESPGKHHMLGAGFLFGLATLARPVGLVLVAAIVGYTMLVYRFNMSRSVKALAPLLLMFLMLVLPWAYRNHVVLDTWQLSTNGGRNLWLGNNPESSIHTGSNIEMPRDLAEQVAEVSEADADQIYKRRALAYMADHPRHTVLLALKKGISLWRLDPSPTTEGYMDVNNWRRAVAIMSYGPVLFLAVFGFIQSPKPYRTTMLLWLLYAAMFSLLHAVFFAKVRFRLPLDFFLISMAGVAVSVIADRFKTKRSIRL